MSLSKHKKMPTYDFPEEILSEIFKRLPVKYVLRCGAVQKSWYYLVRTPMFLTLHLNHQTMIAHNNPRYLLFHNTNTHLLTFCSDDKQCQEYCSIEYPFDFDNHEWYALSNGLICISSMSYRELDYDYNIFICNPLVQMCQMLPVSRLSEYYSNEIEWKALAFAFLPEVNDYVVVHVVKLETVFPDDSDQDSPDYLQLLNYISNTVMIGVYSLNTGSWKISSQDDVKITWVWTEQSVYVNGTAFWIGEDYAADQLVIQFDTKTEILREISVPEKFVVQERQHPIIHPFGKSIAYFVEDAEFRHLDMWILKEDMIDEFSWENIISVNLSENVWADVLGIRVHSSSLSTTDKLRAKGVPIDNVCPRCN
ncbi:hypothetical protein POM88_037894 [Heracleum sosnowskyi]|uniref:F-box domain-containing protein n=1 Tax=Heracleum sosnowskyi TaxID=360622 RepID=A0AAD8HSS3_9APIA|nr:hypothetical protein POM88_037894 [Heracleum sosnowskyi]